MSDSEQVECGTHGPTRSTFACRHLASGVACGFHADDGDPTDAWPDAWCDQCDELQARSGGWPEDLPRGLIQLLCTHCWEAARARNEVVPALARGRAAALTADEQTALIHGAVHALEVVQAAAAVRWGIGGYVRWDFDDASRMLTFSDEHGPRVIADVRMVGSYSTRSDTFQWAWVLYDAGDPLIVGVAGLPALGEVRGLEQLTLQGWPCEIDDAWAMTALAALVLGAEGAYRAPMSEDRTWFMLLSGLRAAA